VDRGRQFLRGLVFVLVFVFLAFSLIFVQAGCGGGAAGPGRTDPPPATGQIPVVAHVFVLVEENHAYGSVIGNSAMPYTNQLANQYALATQYYANRHNSLPNYFMLTVGDLVTTNDLFTGTVTADNLVRALAGAGKSWKIYAESLPSIGYTGPNVVPYSKDHNPFAYISDVLNSSKQTANIVPFTELAPDLQNNTLPDYAMIVPSAVNDGHDCPGEASSCTDTQKLANIDQWIQTNIGPLITSSAMQSSVLIYTWDESAITDLTNGGGHVATILISPKVRAGFQSTTMYQHQSTLKLTMQLLGMTDFPGGAASAPDMTEFF
jgi:phosphatidylinositol-3-phosphatase